MPIRCNRYPAVQKLNNNKNLLIVQSINYGIINMYLHYVEPSVERIIWIAFYKNNDNNKCFFKTIPKDLVTYILELLGKQSLVPPCIKIDV